MQGIPSRSSLHAPQGLSLHHAANRQGIHETCPTCRIGRNTGACCEAPVALDPCR